VKSRCSGWCGSGTSLGSPRCRRMRWITVAWSISATRRRRRSADRPGHRPRTYVASTRPTDTRRPGRLCAARALSGPVDESPSAATSSSASAGTSADRQAARGQDTINTESGCRAAVASARPAAPAAPADRSAGGWCHLPSDAARKPDLAFTGHVPPPLLREGRPQGIPTKPLHPIAVAGRDHQPCVQVKPSACA
jgi:hypothetical protein